MAPILTDINRWIRENQKDFLPPVCNKMLHNSQLKVFYVGGPNQRKDFHIEEGEELFYMKKGDMELIILENNQFRTVPIKEGEIFLLPGRIPHSPQRKADTVGLVIERERLSTEKDGLRYYVDGTRESLFERWFYCEDLGQQLGPVIREFFASEECRTGRPGPNSFRGSPAFEPDSQRLIEEPFSLHDWLEKNRAEIQKSGAQAMFSDNYQSDIIVYGNGRQDITENPTETWLWQLEGSRSVTVGDQAFQLEQDQALLIPPTAEEITLGESENAVTMSVVMNPAKKH